MLLELNVFFYPDGYDPEVWEDMGKEPVMTTGKMTISTSHVACFNPHDNGKHVMVRMDSGDVFEGHMTYEEFGNIMFEDEMSKDVFVSGDN